MKGKTWFQVRLVLMAFAFVSLLAIPSGQFTPGQFTELAEMPSWRVWVSGAMMIIFIFTMPMILQVIFAIQYVNPLSDKTWTRPTHESNPFHLGNPLLFFHFVAYVFGAGSMGTLLSAIWNGLPALLGGLAGILGAFSVLLGVHLAMRLFRSKMAAAA